MPGLAPQERLQPALLDRLTDDAPDKSQEPRESRLITQGKLRQAVLRDLAWLFNATRMGGAIEQGAYPYAARSVLNYGLPALSGATASALDVVELETTLRQVIIDFEPRILPDTLKVEAIVSELQLDHHNVVSVQISGDLWGQPVPIELLLRTEVDLETGEVEIREMG
jgi:type VI secretion system protein ImpF